MDRLPETVREQLPADLKDAEIAGIETADVDDNVRLWGPPGTGKSTQSALRTATRAVEEGLHPSQMTVVTYRKALAGVVRERLLEWGLFDSEDEFQYWTTIHAAASRATGFHDRFADGDDLEGMVDGRAEYRFCKKLEISRSPSKPWFETRWTVFRDLYNYAKNNLLDVGEYPNVPDEWLRPLEDSPMALRKKDEFRRQWESGVEFEHVAEKWEGFKRYHGCYDFYEQLTAGISGSLPPMKHVVIDEYHDATPLMAALTERWVRNAETAIVAGDPDQVVNTYAGADPGFFERLESRTDRAFPVVKLKQSYRCPNEHFAAAARVLAAERDPPELKTAGPGLLNRWPGWEFEESGDEWITPDENKEGSPAYLVDEFGRDIMFLARTRRQVDAIAAALDDSGIAYRSQGGVGGDWEQRLELMNALDLIADATADGADASNYALSSEKARLLRKHTHGRYLNDADGWAAVLGECDGDAISVAMFLDHTTEKWPRVYGRGEESVAKLVRLDDQDKIAMLQAWERYDFPKPPETVEPRALTIHASKGAEASNVVVYDGINGPIQDGMEQSSALRENEARTWYVALTRASKRLHIIRDAFKCDPYLPDDLEPWAASVAKGSGGEGDA